jgi:hypothetical protein
MADMNFLVQNRELLEALASLATIFALFVPLPIFVFSVVQQRRSERLQRTIDLIARLETPEARALRARVLKATKKYDFSAADIEEKLDADDREDIRLYLNENEQIGLYLNTGLVDRRIFLRSWKAAYTTGWTIMRPLVERLRLRLGPELYNEWERAVQNLD